MAEGNSRMNSSEEAVPAETSEQSTTTEMLAPAVSVTQSTATKQEIPAVNYTTSDTVTALKKSRKTIHWICLFQLMKPSPEMIPESISSESVYIEDKNVLSKVDAYIKDAFELFYNRDKSQGKKRRNLVRCLLGGKFVCHPALELIAGVLVLYTRLSGVTPSLNAHLRLEKMKPLQVPPWGKHHQLYFGDCYPIHTEDVVCIQGNSLRALLRNWVDDKFFENLRWIIPPSLLEDFNTSSMRNVQVLLKEMKKNVQANPRKRILGDEMPAVATTSTRNEKIKRDRDMSDNRKIWEYSTVEPGKTYQVKADRWANDDDDLPLHADGYPDMKTYQFVVFIKQKGGIVRRVSICED